MTYAQVSRQQVKRWLDSGVVRVNGRAVVIAKWVVRTGDRLAVEDRPVTEQARERRAGRRFVEVLYEDDTSPTPPPSPQGRGIIGKNQLRNLGACIDEGQMLIEPYNIVIFQLMYLLRKFKGNLELGGLGRVTNRREPYETKSCAEKEASSEKGCVVAIKKSSERTFAKGLYEL